MEGEGLDSFHNAMNIYIERPQVVNRRCAGAVTILQTTCGSHNSVSGQELSDSVSGQELSDHVTDFLTHLCSKLDSSGPIKPSRPLISLIHSLLGIGDALHHCELEKNNSLPVIDNNSPPVTDNNSLPVTDNSLPATDMSSLPVANNLLPVTDTEAIWKLALRKIISKQSHVSFPVEIILQGYSCYHFIPVEVNEERSLCAVGVSYSFSYSFSNMSPNRIQLQTRSHPQLKCKTTSVQWIHSTLLPKITKWAHETVLQDPRMSSVGLSTERGEVISIDVYYEKYTKMKDVYGTAICEIWPECTDPLKFVYEDVAIASYLICVWEEENRLRGRSERQKFVDLGCGNGLLVYILSSEGYEGYGVDVRKRNIWKMFGDRADLREMSLIPTQCELFPDADWLIGNHSDELTPWIPVMAARSSRTCQFFLLPCCPFDFYSKFQRPDSSQGVYSQYLDFVCQVVQICGFTYQRDSMRIPSTRKECIIGTKITDLTELAYKHIETNIEQMIGRTLQAGYRGDLSKDVAFTPRPQVEAVKNCATVPSNVQSKIIKLVTDLLLSTENYKLKPEHGLQPPPSPRWNAGGVVGIHEVAELLKTENLLQPLKAECGGIKTLLKNHHHIFTIVTAESAKHGGYHVRLADFTTDLRKAKPTQRQDAPTPGQATPTRKQATPTQRLKTKLCWFHTSHPDGCLLSDQSCRFAHGEGDRHPSLSVR